MGVPTATAQLRGPLACELAALQPMPAEGLQARAAAGMAVQPGLLAPMGQLQLSTLLEQELALPALAALQLASAPQLRRDRTRQAEEVDLTAMALLVTTPMAAAAAWTTLEPVEPVLALVRARRVGRRRLEPAQPAAVAALCRKPLVELVEAETRELARQGRLRIAALPLQPLASGGL